MNITLRAGERIYINGAVLRTDRKATIELLNDATFLLETHVMQASDATTPLRQIYFVDSGHADGPGLGASPRCSSRFGLIDKAIGAFETTEIKAGLRAITDMIGRARYFEAMKIAAHDVRARAARDVSERRIGVLSRGLKGTTHDRIASVFAAPTRRPRRRRAPPAPRHRRIR